MASIVHAHGNNIREVVLSINFRACINHQRFFSEPTKNNENRPTVTVLITATVHSACYTVVTLHVQASPHRRATSLTKNAVASSISDRMLSHFKDSSKIGCRQRPQKITRFGHYMAKLLQVVQGYWFQTYLEVS